MRNFKFYLIVMIGLAAGLATAGESEYPLFKMGAGGRPVALGGAFTGVADDASAVFWNPAGLAQLQNQFSLEFTNRLHFENTKFLELFAAYSDIKLGSFGLGILSNQIDEISAYDSDFNYLGKFGAYQRAIFLGYAYNLAPVNLGIHLGSVQAGLDPPQGDVSGTGFTMTLGLMTRINKNFKIGSTIRPGFSIKYDDTKDDVPGNARLGLEFRMGTGISSPSDSMRLIIDLDQSNKLPMKINGGLELTFFNLLALRGGINSFVFESRTEDLSSGDLRSANLKFSFGAGLKLPLQDAGNFTFDFGLLSTSLGNSTALTISWAK